MPDYNLIINNNYKRGIFIYVHTSLKYIEVNDPISSIISESLVVDVKLPGSSIAFRVVAIYRSPSVCELSSFNNR